MLGLGWEGDSALMGEKELLRYGLELHTVMEKMVLD
jgi:hypothetical protein